MTQTITPKFINQLTIEHKPTYRFNVFEVLNVPDFPLDQVKDITGNCDMIPWLLEFKDFEFDQNDNLTAYQHKDLKVTMTYDRNNNITSYKDSSGYNWSQSYDSNNNKLSYTDSRGKFEVNKWDDLNRRTLKMNNANTIRSEYITEGNTTTHMMWAEKIEDPIMPTLTYTEWGKPYYDMLPTTPTRIQTTTVDDQNRPIRIVHKNGTTTTWTYEPTKSSYTINPTKKLHTYREYNSNDRLLNERCSDGSFHINEYDDNDNCTFSHCKNKYFEFGPTWYTYDNNNQRISSSNEDDDYVCDAHGRPIRAGDPATGDYAIGNYSYWPTGQLNSSTVVMCEKFNITEVVRIMFPLIKQ